MRPEKFVLEKGILRSAQSFQSHAEDKHAAVNAVAAPGQFAALGIKRHHDPDPEPESGGYDENLAKQEEAVESFRALREHDYNSPTSMRVPDGGTPSTRARMRQPMRCRSCEAIAPELKSDSHTMLAPAA